MQTNPYAPPIAAVELPRTGLKRRSVILMIVFTFLTLGIYYLAWFVRRRPGLNRLNSPRKLELWPILALAADYVLEFVAVFASGDQEVAEAFGAPIALALSIVRLTVGILMIFQCFKIKDILEDHLTADDDGSQRMFTERVKLSGLMTFFFSIFYLQYIINRDIVGAQERPVSASM
jgi:hypothetical protein